MNSLVNEYQRDALQELLNISMGQAADALARLIDAKIKLSIPRISSVSPEDFIAMIHDDHNWRTRQSFNGVITGEVISLLSRTGCEDIAELMGYSVPLNSVTLEELLLEVSNILAGACLRGFADQLDIDTNLSMPTMFKADKYLCIDNYQWSTTLMMEVDFKVELRQFDSKIMICLDTNSIAPLIERINHLLE
ncbi:chemotaxis protein CheC [Aeromonas sp. RU39B]|uniref:chemotaxis protein CheC n=1 Tax=Aeromonas sp. RU39B TaxID=1907416 RepID=UPI000955DEEB|nr:chemotaxis protein CheC [Aeromonas sp. RU39B]SIR04869.1 chemotaxis protein CheC [Aeromonas sp. RU39B]